MGMDMRMRMRMHTLMNPLPLSPPVLSLAIPELAALLQLASPALPVGAFSYSSGLEAAVEHGLVTDAASAQDWIRDGLREVVGRADLPLLQRFHAGWCAGHLQAITDWNAWHLASRESAELRSETEQMGWSLVQLIERLAWGNAERRAALRALQPVGFPCAYAFAAAAIGTSYEAAATAFCFGWTENQVTAAIKSVPLGQTSGQKILFSLRSEIAAAINAAAGLRDDEIVSFAPQLGILSSRHALQYSRIFRS
jgi:urease accessory protein